MGDGYASMENLKHYYPSTGDMIKFQKIQEMDDEEFERSCVFCNDCSICDKAIHRFNLTTTSHICVRGMTEDRFIAEMDNADIYF